MKSDSKLLEKSSCSQEFNKRRFRIRLEHFLKTHTYLIYNLKFEVQTAFAGYCQLSRF